MPLPSFVIAGAQKSGTTTLHQMLQQHPRVFMSRPKELHFFDRNWDRGIDWYTSHFEARKPRHRQWGESTPTYLYDDRTRQRLIDSLPDSRVVIILRNPIDRAYSHYWHSRRKAREPVATFEEALALENERLATDNLGQRKRFSYVDRGHYIDQLVPLHQAFGPEGLHVMLLEDLVADRTSALVGLFAFLGLPVEPAGQIQGRTANAYRDRAADVAPSPTGYPPLSTATRTVLAEHFRPYNDRLSTWLGRDLSHWV